MNLSSLKSSIIIFIVTLGFYGLISCSEDEEQPVDLVGEWKLTEMYLDPGDGSGDFTPVNSNRIVRFFADGTISSNGKLCEMSTNSDENSNGSYDLSNMVIEADCNFFGRDIIFELKNNSLTLSYPCIEACAQKFVKIK